ncbi:hypothetical protein RvY_10656 [Ramazzottius varieornatus]|uniref:Neural proliferation differentiation and control protein 1 n=1 Tax=Ramazzottius varieornatus TaxID=947166 RepID=A0A1D1VFX6_RAMVA|nr:hypothetical protein RvY_10656 [Ramazzottius varieornatus]
MSFNVLFVATLLVSLSLVSSWPINYLSQGQYADLNDDTDYQSPLYQGQEAWGDDRGADQTYNDQPSYDEAAPSLTYEDLAKLRELIGGEPSSNIDFGNVDMELPVAKFSTLGPDATNNGGAGPFKFSKPTTPAPVEKKSEPKVLIKIPKRKVHVATISDETPLYLNYADKEDGSKSALKPAAMPQPTPVLKEEENNEKIIEENEQNFPMEDSEEDETMVILPEEDGEKEIDFTQQLAFPDFSGTVIETVSDGEGENDEEPSEDTEQQASENAQVRNEAPADKAKGTAEVQPDTPSMTPSATSSQVFAVPAAPFPLPSGDTEAHLVAHNDNTLQVSHLNMVPEMSYVPSPEYGFVLKTTGEKRAPAETLSSQGTATDSGVVLPIAFAVTGCTMFACICAALFYRRGRKRTLVDDAEEPAYGVTGPGPIKPSFLDLSGDRSLAKSAETYHYQHQKRQIMSSVEHNPSSADSSTATPRSGDHSDYDSEDDDGDNEDYGDYTVYECPGLAPAGEIEVVNPMFAGSNKPSPQGE